MLGAKSETSAQPPANEAKMSSRAAAVLDEYRAARASSFDRLAAMRGSTQRHSNPRLFFDRRQIPARKCRKTRVFRLRRLRCGAMLRNALFAGHTANAAENAATSHT